MDMILLEQLWPGEILEGCVSAMYDTSKDIPTAASATVDWQGAEA